jgi:hypothetical protein
VEIVAEMRADCEPATLFAEICDLERYGRWSPLVHRAERVSDDPAWEVELRTVVGPFARSKRLRMMRTGYEPDRLVVFERAEVDGRQHAPWTLRAELDHDGSSTGVRMTLHYGGSLWTGGALKLVLDEQIKQGSERLRELVSDGSSRPKH